MPITYKPGGVIPQRGVPKESPDMNRTQSESPIESQFQMLADDVAEAIGFANMLIGRTEPVRATYPEKTHETVSDEPDEPVSPTEERILYIRSQVNDLNNNLRKVLNTLRI